VSAIEDIQTGTLVELERVLAGGKFRVFVSDLSFGGWRSDHVATEICAQMGLEPPPPERTDSAPEIGETADVIGRFVDGETAGNTVAVRAATLAQAIGDALAPGTVIAIVAPRFGFPCGEPNARLVERLAAVLPTRGARLMLVVAHGVGRAPATGLRSLVPGILAPDVAAAIDAREGRSEVRSLALEKGFELVAPEWRPEPEQVPDARFAELDVIAQACHAPWISAYAQCHGHELLVDAAWLGREAARRFSEGNTDLALRLAERAASCARDLSERLAGESVLQGMRIAAQRFQEAAAQADPPPEAPAAQRAFLLEAKGWGLTMTRESHAAERYLGEARALMDEKLGDERDRLYLLNISALNRLRLGDFEGALAMEHEIERRHARLRRRDWRLEYLNTLNTARLLRQLGRLEEALAYFERAFATTLGVRSPSDAVYVNVTRARLANEAGRATAAFEGFVRAAAHWLALGVPESLASRATRAVTRQSAGSGGDRVEEVSAALLTALLEHAPRAGRDDLADAVRARNREPLSFVCAHDLPAGAEVGWAAMGPGLGVLAAVGATGRPPPTDPPSHVALRAAVSAALERAWPASDGAVAVIDDRLGHDVPTTDVELLESSLRLRGRGLTRDGRRMQLDGPLRSRLEEGLHVALGSAVDRVEPGAGRARVVFKRRLAPATLTAREAKLVSLVDDEPTVAQLRERVATTDIRATLRGLELRRVVTLRATAGSCAAAGLELGAGPTPRSAGNVR
jgi:tetratricopeptide (TPR) repeat protein